jgi:hypothetical protein
MAFIDWIAAMARQKGRQQTYKNYWKWLSEYYALHSKKKEKGAALVHVKRIRIPHMAERRSLEITQNFISLAFMEAPPHLKCNQVCCLQITVRHVACGLHTVACCCGSAASCTG